MPLELPQELSYGKVVGRFLLAVGDSNDDLDRLPDARPLVGTVLLTPAISNMKIAGGEPTTVVRAPIRCTVDDYGRLTDPAGLTGVWLVAGIYKVTYSFANAQLPGHTIEVLPTHTLENPLDLTNAIPAGGTPILPSQYEELSAQIDAIPDGNTRFLVEVGGVYPARPNDGLPVAFLGPDQPATMIPGDVWVDTDGGTPPGDILDASVITSGIFDDARFPSRLSKSELDAAYLSSGGSGGGGKFPLAALESTQQYLGTGYSDGIWGYTQSNPGGIQPEGIRSINSNQFRYNKVYGPGFTFDPFAGQAGYDPSPYDGWWADSGWGALNLLRPGWYSIDFFVKLRFMSQPSWCCIDADCGAMNTNEQQIPIQATRYTSGGTHSAQGYYSPGPFYVSADDVPVNIQPRVRWQGGVDLATTVASYIMMSVRLLSVD